jgi:7-cyano-7-deazaguanine synthase
MDLVEDAFLPGRNLLLLTAGSAYGYSKNARGVAIGLLDERTALFPDQTTEFIEHAQKVIDVAMGDHIEILAPLQSASKADVLRMAESLLITGTYSCHAGKESPCGRCISCVERESAMRHLMER